MLNMLTIYVYFLATFIHFTSVLFAIYSLIFRLLIHLILLNRFCGCWYSTTLVLSQPADKNEVT